MVRVVCQLFTTTSQTTKTILLPSVLLYSVTFFVPSYHQLRLVNVFLRALVILQVSYSLYWLLYVVLIPTNFYFLHTSNGGCRREEKSRNHWSLFTKLLFSQN